MIRNPYAKKKPIPAPLTQRNNTNPSKVGENLKTAARAPHPAAPSVVTPAIIVNVNSSSNTITTSSCKSLLRKELKRQINLLKKGDEVRLKKRKQARQPSSLAPTAAGLNVTIKNNEMIPIRGLPPQYVHPPIQCHTVSQTSVTPDRNGGGIEPLIVNLPVSQLNNDGEVNFSTVPATCTQSKKKKKKITSTPMVIPSNRPLRAKTPLEQANTAEEIKMTQLEMKYLIRAVRKHGLNFDSWRQSIQRRESREISITNLNVHKAVENKSTDHKTLPAQKSTTVRQQDLKDNTAPSNIKTESKLSSEQCAKSTNCNEKLSEKKGEFEVMKLEIPVMMKDYVPANIQIVWGHLHAMMTKNIDTKMATFLEMCKQEEYRFLSSLVPTLQKGQITYFNDKERAVLRSFPKRGGGCKCGSNDHKRANYILCPLYRDSMLLEKDNPSLELTFEEKDFTYNKSKDRQSSVVVGAIKARFQRLKTDQEKDQIEASFISKMEMAQLKRGKALFCPSLSVMIISAVNYLENTRSDSMEGDADSDKDGDKKPALVLVQEKRKQRIELLDILEYVSRTWGHIYYEIDHMQYSWRHFVYNKNTDQNAGSAVHMKNPVQPGSLSFEASKYFLDKPTFEKLNENPCSGDEAQNPIPIIGIDKDKLTLTYLLKVHSNLQNEAQMLIDEGFLKYSKVKGFSSVDISKLLEKGKKVLPMAMDGVGSITWYNRGHLVPENISGLKRLNFHRKSLNLTLQNFHKLYNANFDRSDGIGEFGL